MIHESAPHKSATQHSAVHAQVLCICVDTMKASTKPSATLASRGDDAPVAVSVEVGVVVTVSDKLPDEVTVWVSDILALAEGVTVCAYTGTQQPIL